jgi:hypothetical protein
MKAEVRFFSFMALSNKENDVAYVDSNVSEESVAYV